MLLSASNFVEICYRSNRKLIKTLKVERVTCEKKNHLLFWTNAWKTYCSYIIYLMNETYLVTDIMHPVVQKKIKDMKKNIKHDLCSPKEQIFRQ